MLTTTETFKVERGKILAANVSTVKVPSVSRLTPSVEPLRAYESESIMQIDEFEEAYASISGNLEPKSPMCAALRLGKETYRLQSGIISILNTDDSTICDPTATEALKEVKAITAVVSVVKLPL